MDTIENVGITESHKLYISDEAKKYLNETSKWAKILAIIGFVSIGFIVLLAVFMAFFMGDLSPFFPDLGGMGGMMGITVAVIYLIMAAIYMYPVWKLYQFAIKAKQALLLDDVNLLTQSLECQKSLFKFLGIFTLIILCLYGIMFAIFGTALIGSMF